MQTKVPLFRRIATDRNRYLYDAATNRIFSVSKLLFDQFDRIAGLTQAEIDALGADDPDCNETRAAWEILDARRRATNCFPTSRPTIGMAWSPEEVARRSAHECGIIVLEVTTRCNLRCSYCVFSGNYPSNRSHGSDDMGADCARRAIDFAYQCSDEVPDGQVGLGFTGGEPLLNWPVIREAMDYARTKDWGARQLHFNMTTNATLLNRARLDFLAAHNVNLTISLDGPASVHDRARRFADGTGTHEHVRRNMELIRTAYPDYSRERVMFAAVLSDPIDWGVLNQYFCEELQLPSGKLITADVRDGSQETAARTGDGRNFGIVYGAWRQALAGGCLFGTWPGGSRKAKLKALGQTCLSFRAITVPLVRLHERHICKQGWPDGVFQPGGCCLMPTRRLLVAHDGTLFPCDRSDQNAGTTVGNIRDGIDTERVFVLLRDFFDATRAECADCWAIRLCTQCAGTVVDRSGISRDAKLSRCDEIRRSAEDLLTQYCSILEQYPHAFKHNGEVSIERPALRKLT